MTPSEYRDLVEFLGRRFDAIETRLTRVEVLAEENRHQIQIVAELLAQGLGVGGARSNGLAALAGNWNEEEFQRFGSAVALFEEIDPEL